MSTQSSYNELVQELEKLLASLEQESINMDELSDKLEKGFELIEELNKRLHATETKIREVIQMRSNKAQENESIQE